MLDRCSERRFDHPSLDVDIRSTSFLEIPLCKKFPRKKVYKWRERSMKLRSDETLHSIYSFYTNIFNIYNIFFISSISRLYCSYCMHSLLILRGIIERKERKRERFFFKLPINLFLLKFSKFTGTCDSIERIIQSSLSSFINFTPFTSQTRCEMLWVNGWKISGAG